jgi:hypothetical protein
MKLVTSIIDFTSALNPKVGEYIFNPSISSVFKNLYLCSYRVFKNKYNKHPWDCNWIEDVEYDETRFCLLEINQDNSVRVDYHYDLILKYQVDCRIIKKSMKKYFAIVSAKLRQEVNIGDDNLLSITGNPNINCKDQDCMVQLFYELTLSDKKTLTRNAPSILCKNLSSSMEKNWSGWIDQDNLFITYGFSHGPSKKWLVHTPVIDFINLKPNPARPITCNILNVDNNVVLDFVHIESLFESIPFSLSTPAIKSKLGNHWIGIGHIKINKNKSYTFPCIQKFIQSITQTCSEHHPSFYYACFFYTFVKTTIDTYRIIGVSKMFLFYPCDYSVIFPCGVDYLNNDLIVSYGDGDRSCKLVIIDEASIEWISSIKTCEEWNLMAIKHH